MIHWELCSACRGPLQLGVGLVIFIIRIYHKNKNRGNIFYIFNKHSVSSGVLYEGANFMINGLPEISISFFSELARIIYSLGFHNLFVNIISILETKLYQRPVAVMHWRVCYIMGAD